jgi:hypothetical protein
VGTPQLLRHYAAVARAAVDWDGTHPVRAYSELPPV